MTRGVAYDLPESVTQVVGKVMSWESYRVSQNIEGHLGLEVCHRLLTLTVTLALLIALFVTGGGSGGGFL